MTAITAAPPDDTLTRGAEPTSAWRTLVRGLQLSPEFRVGLPVTLLLALVATAGRIVVPIAVQQTIDHGLNGPTVDVGLVRRATGAAAVGLLVTMVAAYLMNVRLYRSTETGLAALRVRAFRHVHDLSVLHQAAQRRGALVSRVTSDVDEISQFMQWGGVMLLVSAGQLVLATGLMAYYSWPLTLLVYACFFPLVLALRNFQRRLDRRYAVVRERVGAMLGAVAETVVGTQVIRAYGVEARTARRIDTAIDAHRRAATSAQVLAAGMYSVGEVVAGVATAGVVVGGVLLGIGGNLSAGRLVAFLFLVQLFLGPVQVATEVLDEGETAVAGWRRVLGILDTPADVPDPAAVGSPAGGTGGVAARDLPPGPLAVRFERVSFGYPDGPVVLAELDLDIAPRRRVAVVGETGSGKTTFAKLLTRLMDPTDGRVLLSGVPIATVGFDSLRHRVGMVPQDGFLFDATVAANVRYGRPDSTDADIGAAFAALGLADWLAGLPAGLATPVGERGESLSAGERQLVSVARAYVADPDLLVLDEATSAVDPATDVRLQRALQGLTRGRTSVTIAHRLATAEAADDVIVFAAGRVVQRGPHAELVGVPGRYAELHAAWMARAR
jgi:ATP-binding cassette subfamily B protein